MDRLTLVLVCMLCSAAASAGIITIKASDYVAGDNISNPNLDVVLSYRSTPKTPGLPEIIEPVLIEGSGDNLTFGTTFNIDPYARAIVRGQTLPKSSTAPFASTSISRPTTSV